MKAKELRSMDEAGLKSKLSELKLSLVKDNVQVKTGTQVKNSGNLKKTKKTIARIHTILVEKHDDKNSKKTSTTSKTKKSKSQKSRTKSRRQ